MIFFLHRQLAGFSNLSSFLLLYLLPLSLSFCLVLSHSFLLPLFFSLCVFLTLSAQVFGNPEEKEEEEEGRDSSSHIPCRATLSWGKDDRKSARWHRAGLQHVTSSLERQEARRRGGRSAEEEGGSEIKQRR